VVSPLYSLLTKKPHNNNTQQQTTPTDNHLRTNKLRVNTVLALVLPMLFIVNYCTLIPLNIKKTA